MFYDKFCELCTTKNLSPSRVALEIGINKGTVSVWKNKGTMPSAENLKIIAKYFGVTVDYLLENEKREDSTIETQVTDDDIRFALFDGSDNITDEMYEEVKSFAKYIKEKYKRWLIIYMK